MLQIAMVSVCYVCRTVQVEGQGLQWQASLEAQQGYVKIIAHPRFLHLAGLKG